MDCGAACLRMIARHHGRFFSLEYLRELSYVDREGVSLRAISEAAETIGYNTLAAKLDFHTLVEDVPLPAIVHWRQEHFVVVYKTSKKKISIADPASGKVTLTTKEFLEGWASDTDEGKDEGIVLMLEPTPELFEKENVKVNRSGFRFLFRYLFRYKALLFQLLLGISLGLLLQLTFPFLTQAIVDYGIEDQDIGFVQLILIAQIVLFFSHSAVEIIRSWILLHIGMRVNISLISDFLLKMMRLPMKFFNTKMTGDILQRIGDHQRIEEFMTSNSLSTLFSLLTFVVFGGVLLFYSPLIFFVFLAGTVLYVLWIVFFLKRRKILDYKQFDKMAENNNTIIEIISGMPDIKLHNSERLKRWEWERIQAALYRIGIKNLALGQYQSAGASFLNELKNIIISYIAAKSVIEGQMSLGMMLAVQYIIGQLNGPIHQLMNFIRSAQDARISLERLNEIHDKEEEESVENKASILPDSGNLNLENVSFQYSGPGSPMVLKDVSLEIPQGKTTAIVGTSGSGKTTLLKLLLNFYVPTDGQIKLGDMTLNTIRNSLWRSRCGVVMQDGFIFTDTIAKNIALGEEIIDKKRLLEAVKTAHIQSFIEALPLGYNTRIGQNGIGLSQGQRQRILIARAVYKNPEYIFFDEATNALDAFSEMIIMENLKQFLLDKTVVIVAHRLSTVKDADNIIVLDNGELVEQGSHSELTQLKGAYYHLVKNQLELGG